MHAFGKGLAILLGRRPKALSKEASVVHILFHSMYLKRGEQITYIFEFHSTDVTLTINWVMDKLECSSETFFLVCSQSQMRPHKSWKERASGNWRYSIER